VTLIDLVIDLVWAYEGVDLSDRVTVLITIVFEFLSHKEDAYKTLP